MSEKSELAPATEQQLEVFETESEKCTFEFKSALSNLIYHHQSIKNVFGFFFKCAIQISSMYKFTISTKLGIKH